MAQLNKNEMYRVRRVQQALEKVLDALHGAQGLLYPAGLKTYREQVNALIKEAEKLQGKIEATIPRSAKRPPLQPAEPGLEIDGEEEFDEPSDGD